MANGRGMMSMQLAAQIDANIIEFVPASTPPGGEGQLAFGVSGSHRVSPCTISMDQRGY